MVETIVFEHIRDVFCICETYSTYSVYARRILYMRTNRTNRTNLSKLGVRSHVPLRGAFVSEKQRPFFSLVFGVHVPLRGLFFLKNNVPFSAWKERPAHLPARVPFLGAPP